MLQDYGVCKLSLSLVKQVHYDARWWFQRKDDTDTFFLIITSPPVTRKWLDDHDHKVVYVDVQISLL